MRNDEPSSASEDEGPPPAPTIGETLRAAREFHRASIERVSEVLRLETRFVVALEEDRFDEIGPPVFVKGYLKHYCELLGLDPEPLLRDLRERLRDAEPPLKARLPAEREQGPPGTVAIAVAVVALALAAVGVWYFGKPSGDRAAEPPAATAGESAEPSRMGQAGIGAATGTVARPATSTAGPPDSGREAASGSAPELDFSGAEPVTPPQPTTGDGAMPADSAGASGAVPAPAGDDAALQNAAAADGGSVTPAPGGSVLPAGGDSLPPDGGAGVASRLEIELRFVEDSWTEITSAGGERLFYGLGRAGAEERIRTDDEVRVLLGNADGVVIRVNGEPFAYPAGSRNGNLARFRLSPEN